MLDPVKLMSIAVGLRDTLLEHGIHPSQLCDYNSGCGPTCDPCNPLLDPWLYRLRALPGINSSILSVELLLDSIGDEFEIVHLDVGSRSSPARPGGLILLKHAESVLIVRDGRSWRETRHLSSPPLGPLLLLEAGAARAERVRQAARYLLELGRVYTLLSKAHIPTIIFKHGPLVELISIYLNPAFNAERSVYRRVLLHAGIDEGEADAILDAAGSGNSVNPGIIALNLLERIAELQSRDRKLIAVGVVEDTSVSRHLVAQLVYESLLAASKILEAENKPTETHGLIEVLLDSAKRGETILDATLDAGKCLGETDEYSDLRGAVQELILSIYNRLLAHGEGFASVFVRDGRWKLAAAVYQEAGRLEFYDSDVILLVDFLAGGVVTSVISNSSIFGLVRLAAKQRLREHRLIEHVERILARLVHVYVYATPAMLPTCYELEAFVRNLGADVEPWVAAQLVRAPLPLRIDTVSLANDKGVYIRDVSDRLVAAAALAQLASTLTVYKLIPGLIEADVRSRVRLNESLILAELARQLAGRLQPYGIVLRHWPRRSATIT